jgi:hypothetical protein
VVVASVVVYTVQPNMIAKSVSHCWPFVSQCMVLSVKVDVLLMLRRYKRLLNFGDYKARDEVWLESFQLRTRPQKVVHDDADEGDDEPDKLTY